jgi:hypothetical protein
MRLRCCSFRRYEAAVRRYYGIIRRGTTAYPTDTRVQTTDRKEGLDFRSRSRETSSTASWWSKALDDMASFCCRGGDALAVHLLSSCCMHLRYGDRLAPRVNVESPLEAPLQIFGYIFLGLGSCLSCANRLVRLLAIGSVCQEGYMYHSTLPFPRYPCWKWTAYERTFLSLFVCS